MWLTGRPRIKNKVSKTIVHTGLTELEAVGGINRFLVFVQFEVKRRRVLHGSHVVVPQDGMSDDGLY